MYIIIKKIWKIWNIWIALMLFSGTQGVQASFCSGVCSCGMQILCQCTNNQQEVVVPMYQVPGGISNLTVNDCQKVTFEKYSIRSISSLRHVNIVRVRNVILLESSLEWDGYADAMYQSSDYDTPALTVTIQDSTVQRIHSYALKGRIRNVIFRNTSIQHIKSFAFSALHSADTIFFDRCQIHQMDIRAFKKFELNNLIIKDTTFKNPVISTVVSDVTVRQLVHFDNCHFDVLKSSAFVIFDPIKVEILNTTFNEVYPEAFRIETRGDVTFERNTFQYLQSNAFYGFSLNSRVLATLGKREFLFERNHMTRLGDTSLRLNYTGFELTLLRNRVQKACACENKLYWQRNFIDNLNEIDCFDEASQFVQTSKYLSKFCNEKSGSFITTGLVILVILVVGIVWLILRVTRRQKKMSKTDGDVDAKNVNLPLVMPENKTYQINVFVEEAQLLETGM